MRSPVADQSTRPPPRSTTSSPGTWLVAPAGGTAREARPRTIRAATTPRKVPFFTVGWAAWGGDTVRPLAVMLGGISPPPPLSTRSTLPEAFKWPGPRDPPRRPRPTPPVLRDENTREAARRRCG